MRSGAGRRGERRAVLGDDVAQRERELSQSLVAHRGDLEHAEAACLEIGAHQVGEFLRLRDVHLVERDELRALQQRDLPLGDRVGGELGQDDLEVAQRVAAGFQRRAVEDVHERRAALDVAQELEPEALALARALDEPGHVRDGVPLLPRLDDTEVRVQRRERIVRDLGAGGRDRRDEARLARRGEADECDIRDRLQLEEDVALPAGRAEQGEAGRLALGVGERGVAEPAQATGGRHEAHARLDHVDERLAGLVLDDRADRHEQLERLAGGAGAVIAHAEAAVAGGAVRRVVVRQQGRDLRVGDEHHVTAVTAVAAVGTGERLELLALDRHAAVAALAGAQMQRHSVDERDHAVPLRCDAARWSGER